MSNYPAFRGAAFCVIALALAAGSIRAFPNVTAQLAAAKIVTLVLRDDTQAGKTVDFYPHEDGAANMATLTTSTQ